MNFIINFIIIFISLNGKYNCPDVKEGVFTVPTDDSGLTTVERKDGFQFENNEKLNVTMRYDISWTDDCNYILSNPFIFEGEYFREVNKTDSIFVQIIDVTKKKYTASISSNFSSLQMTTTLKRAR